MPDWCQQFTISCPLLFPFETRQLYFNATAFGASRYAYIVIVIIYFIDTGHDVAKVTSDEQERQG